MDKEYIDIPDFTTLNDIINNNYTLSATQYKNFNIKNKNQKEVASFLARDLKRSDLGAEVGSESYVENSEYTFIKTKALQEESLILSETNDAIQYITPKNFINMNLKKGDVIISKDSNVGEIIILEQDYPNAMLCGALYKLPIGQYKYYLLAFIKSDLFRQQIDFLVPKGSTIRHGKTKFLECKIPMPNKNIEQTITYIELLMKAIIEKETLIKEKYKKILQLIQEELESNQKDDKFSYALPSINEILEIDRMDSCLYSKEFKQKEFLISNYKYGCSTIKALGFDISRGQNLQVSNIGKSIQTKTHIKGYYTLILPKFISKYGTVNEVEYLGNRNNLKTLKKGDIIFGAEGNEKGRSLAIIENKELAITNIHGITLNQKTDDITKSIFVKLFLDYYRFKGMIDDYAVGGNGGSLAIKYWDYIQFPNFPPLKEEEIVKLYHNKNVKCDPYPCMMTDFLKYDNEFNKSAGIYDLDKSLKQLKVKVNQAIDDIANDIEVIVDFSALKTHLYA